VGDVSKHNRGARSLRSSRNAGPSSIVVLVACVGRSNARLPSRMAEWRAMPTELRLVFCTVPDAATAARLAETLVSERLAACVNALPGITSTYRWEGRIETATEQLLLIKCSVARLPALQARIESLHPYELPEIVAVEVASGLPRYLAWALRESAPET
jgi:periplasmic divalent cation tolerance protein